MKFLGMQIMVEGLALAAFGTIRDTATNPLLRDLTAAVMDDESRHVAFGVLSLREFYHDLPEKDRIEREDFVYEACVLMRDRLTNREVWEAMGLDADECIAHSDQSRARASSSATGSSRRSCPNVKSLGLLSPTPARALRGARHPRVRDTTRRRDVDHDVEIERRVRAGEIELTDA